MNRLDQSAVKRAAKNLEAARIRAGYRTAKAAAEALEIPVRSYNEHERGNRKYTRLLDFYAEKFNISAEELLFGNGAIKHPPNGHSIPHLDYSTIGTEPLEKLLREAKYSALFQCGPRLFLATNPDRAMTSPTNTHIMPGDTLGFCPDIKIKPGDYVLARVEGMEEPVFRVFYSQRAGVATYKALSPTIEDIVAKKNQWVNLAKLHFVIKSAETIG